MSKFREWYMTYSVEITWFIIGLCFMSGLFALANGAYLNAVINFGIAYINYAFNKK